MTVAAAGRIAAMQNRVARHFSGSEMKVIRSNASSFGDDGSVTIAVQPQTVPCSALREWTAMAEDGSRVPTGETYVLVDRSLPLDFELGVDQVVELDDEQLRISKIERMPGAFRVFLSGAAAGGAEGS